MRSDWLTAAAPRFSGLVTEAAMLASSGGLACYRLRLRPWLWRRSEVRNRRVWQDKTVKKTITASVPTSSAIVGVRAHMIECYDTAGQYFYANDEQVQCYALLKMEANESRSHLWPL